jgi:carboxypeptidase PM20D1
MEHAMKLFTQFLCLAVFSLPLIAAEQIRSEHAQKTLEIYTRIISMETSKGLGNVPDMANYLADELKSAGFPAGDVEVVPLGETAVLIAKYNGDGSSGNAPILLLGHMDVVEADPKDWERPPFELTQDDKNFYARGSIDNKYGIAQLVSTFIRLKKEGFVPTRDLIITFSGDEESGMKTTQYLAYEREDLAKAEFALNSDAGGGGLDAQGNPVIYSIQAAEKTFATWDITARNPGGHSSRPRPDNAIYDLADAITKIQHFRFPVQWSEMTLAYFQQTGSILGGELGDAMVRFAANPKDEAAADRLFVESSYVGTTRTTCVVTMLQAGHAENALPQSATAAVNCRIFPGVSVAEIESALRDIIENPAIEISLRGKPTASPASKLRPDVVAAVSKAVHARYPDLKVIGYMTSGGTDGKHFRKAGIPTFAVSGRFMDPDEVFAHGLNERLPIDAFYGGLDHWSIVLKELAGPGR